MLQTKKKKKIVKTVMLLDLDNSKKKEDQKKSKSAKFHDGRAACRQHMPPKLDENGATTIK